MDKEGFLTYKNKIFVPGDQELRRDVVKRYHDSKFAGHPGNWKTAELVKRKYWWPLMGKFIGEYIKGCRNCQQYKVNIHPTQAPPIPLESISDALPCNAVTT